MYMKTYNASLAAEALSNERLEVKSPAGASVELQVAASQSFVPVKNSRFSSLFLPPPLPGETAYSVCARIAGGNSLAPDVVSLRVLGHRRGYAHWEALVGMATLEEVYLGRQGQFAADELWIRNHTSYGAVLPFMSANRRARVVGLLRSSAYSSALNGLAGTRRGDESTGLALRRCPDCATIDLNSRGVTWWRSVHQFAGVWVCPWHGRPLQLFIPVSSKVPVWWIAQQPDALFKEIAAEARTLEALSLVAISMVWCSTHWSLWPSTLAILVRARLRRAGLIGSETRIRDAELRSIHEHVAGVLAKSSVPHFRRFADPSWVAPALAGGEFSQPLRWAMLLASTLPLGSQFTSREHLIDDVDPHGRVDFGLGAPAELDIDLAHALERTPQLSLFVDSRCRRFSRAPIALYRAMGHGLQVAVAAQVSGLDPGEVRLWLKKDPELSVHWHESIGMHRTAKAELAITQYVAKNPEAMRSTVLGTQLSAVRALERYAPERLDQLIPASQPKYVRQLRLDF
jgi:hypothetical protein